MILPYLDSVGMDLKLPRVGENRWQEHAEFLKRCHQSSVEVFVKVIISKNTDPAELECSVSRSSQPGIPVVFATSDAPQTITADG